MKGLQLASLGLLHFLHREQDASSITSSHRALRLMMVSRCRVLERAFDPGQGARALQDRHRSGWPRSAGPEAGVPRTPRRGCRTPSPRPRARPPVLEQALEDVALAGPRRRPGLTGGQTWSGRYGECGPKRRSRRPVPGQVVIHHRRSVHAFAGSIGTQHSVPRITGKLLAPCGAPRV